MQKSKKIMPSLKAKIAKAYEFPIECAGDIPVVEIKGRFEAYVTGCSKIKEYTSDKISFTAEKYCIEISGEDLVMSDFNAGCVCISGIISSVNIE